MPFEYLPDMPTASEGSNSKFEYLPEQSASIHDNPNLVNKVGNGLTRLGKYVLGVAEQGSYGAMRQLNDLDQFIGGASPEEIARRNAELPEPEGVGQNVARIAGEYLTPVGGPVGIPFKAGDAALKSLAKTPQAMRISQKLIDAIPVAAAREGISDLSKASTGFVKKVGDSIANIPNKIATIKGLGFSEKVTQTIADDPSVVFESSRPWQAISTEMFDAISKLKEISGKAVEAAKEKVLSNSEDIEVPVSPMINKIDKIQETIEGASKKLHKTMDKIKKIIVTGGEGDNKRWINQNLETLNLRGLFNAKEAVNTLLGQLRNKSRNGIIGTTKDDVKFINAANTIRDSIDEAISMIPDQEVAQEYKRANQAYSKFNTLSEEMGPKGLRRSKTASVFRKAMRRDNENLFDSFQELLPNNLFKEAISKVISKPPSQVISVGVPRAASLVKGTVDLLPEFAAGISGATPGYAATTGANIVGSGARGIAGGARVAAKGLKAAAPRLGIRISNEQE